jgi:heptosyltransferase-3
LTHERAKKNFFVITSLRNLVASILSPTARVRKRMPEEIRSELEAGTIRKVLLLRQQQGIGDMLLATPAIKALKTAYPSAQFHLLASRQNFVAVKDNPRLDRVWIWPKRDWRALRSTLQQLKSEHFDLAIPLVSNTPSLTSLLVAKAVRAGAVWSYDSTTAYGGTNWSRKLADVEIPAPPEDVPEWKKFAALVSPLAEVPDPAPEIWPTPDDEKRIEELWPCYARPGLLTVSLFLGGNAGRAGRLWLPDAWARLAQLLEAEKFHVVAIRPPKGVHATGSSKREVDFYTRFRAELGRDVPVFDEKGLGKAAAFVRRCDLFICPDGGLFHVGCAAGARTLGLFFATDPESWCPSIPSVKALRAPSADPASLTPEAVLAEARRLLAPPEHTRDISN